MGQQKKKNNNKMTQKQLIMLNKFLLILTLIFLLSTIILSILYNSAKKKKTSESAIKAKAAGYVVCIDAGHGGKDNGTSGLDGSLEKDDNLRLSLLVKKELENRGVTVVMTRSDDSFVELGDRASIANDANADLFVSLHRNASPTSSSTCGIEVWIHSSGAENSYKIANDILDQLETAGISQNRGVRAGTQGNSDSNYAVIKDTKMTSLILEMGFMSNQTDLDLFNSNIKQYASSIANGIINWLNETN